MAQVVDNNGQSVRPVWEHYVSEYQIILKVNTSRTHILPDTRSAEGHAKCTVLASVLVQSAKQEI